MTAARIIETNEGIQSEVTAEIFDEFAKGMRDKGWNGVADMIASGINGGDILEIGPRSWLRWPGAGETGKSKYIYWL